MLLSCECCVLAFRNNLRILGVMELDYGIFQCVASNPAGNIQSAALLTVTKEGNLVFILRLFLLYRKIIIFFFLEQDPQNYFLTITFILICRFKTGFGCFLFPFLFSYFYDLLISVIPLCFLVFPFFRRRIQK